MGVQLYESVRKQDCWQGSPNTYKDAHCDQLCAVKSAAQWPHRDKTRQVTAQKTKHYHWETEKISCLVSQSQHLLAATCPATGCGHLSSKDHVLLHSLWLDYRTEGELQDEFCDGQNDYCNSCQPFVHIAVEHLRQDADHNQQEEEVRDANIKQQTMNYFQYLLEVLWGDPLSRSLNTTWQWLH